MEAELKPCPFCGGEAVMNTGEYHTQYVENKKEIPNGANILRQVKYPNGKSYYEYRRKAYIPRCVDKGCMGRIRRMFESEAEAVIAWNRRTEDA